MSQMGWKSTKKLSFEQEIMFLILVRLSKKTKESFKKVGIS